MITLDDLRAICKHTTGLKLSLYVAPLNDSMGEFEIDQNVARETHFLAQAAHETGGFNYLKELASGDAYEGRKDLGNAEPGQGRLYKGEGIFQLTGADNFKKAGYELFADVDWFFMNPELAARPEYACRIAGWYWKTHGLNELADRGDSMGITKRINGGLNGYQDRLAYLTLAQERLA